MITMAHQIHQHGERGLPLNADWKQASLMGSMPAGFVYHFLRLTARTPGTSSEVHETKVYIQ